MLERGLEQLCILITGWSECNEVHCVRVNQLYITCLMLQIRNAMITESALLETMLLSSGTLHFILAVSKIPKLTKNLCIVFSVFLLIAVYG